MVETISAGIGHQIGGHLDAIIKRISSRASEHFLVRRAKTKPSGALPLLLSAGLMAVALNPLEAEAEEPTVDTISLSEPTVDMAELNTVEDGGDELTEADADFLESDDVSASKPSKPHHLLAMRGTIVPSLRIAAGRTSFAASPLARVVVR